MGLAKRAVVLLLLTVVAALCGVSMGAAVYRVGESAGWTNTAQFDYKSWAASKTFQVGDTIVFEYNNQFQNVKQVTHKNFNACNSTAAKQTFSTGNDYFTIRRTGHYYFICDLPGHCEAGQKVDIRVPKNAPSPPPTASTTPPTTSTPPPTSTSTPLPPQSQVTSPSPSPSVSAHHNGASLSVTVWLSVVVVALSVCAVAY